MMNSKMMKSGGMAKKGASAKTLPMVKKDGKMVPAFAADGKGKMASGGMVKPKMAAGGGMMKAKMAASGGMMKSKMGMSGGASKGGVGEEVMVRGSGAARSRKAKIY
jgi:hypothetical protein